MNRLIDVGRREHAELGDGGPGARVERGHRLSIGSRHVLAADNALERGGGQELLDFRQQIGGRCGGDGHDGKLSPEE